MRLCAYHLHLSIDWLWPIDLSVLTSSVCVCVSPCYWSRWLASVTLVVSGGGGAWRNLSLDWEKRTAILFDLIRGLPVCRKWVEPSSGMTERSSKHNSIKQRKEEVEESVYNIDCNVIWIGAKDKSQNISFLYKIPDISILFLLVCVSLFWWLLLPNLVVAALYFPLFNTLIELSSADW